MAMTSPRERLIDAATRLFAAGGYHAVGITRILTEAGVSRVALYHHFRSKQELILAVLRRRDEASRNIIMREVEQASSPRERLLALFDFLDRFVGQPDFTGCMFLNAAAEYHDEDDPIHRTATEHKRMMLSFIERQCIDGGAPEPRQLAHQLYMLFDGAIVQVHAAGEPDDRTAAASAAAAALLTAAGIL